MRTVPAIGGNTKAAWPLWRYLVLLVTVTLLPAVFLTGWFVWENSKQERIRTERQAVQWMLTDSFMELHQLRYLRATVRSGSITRAAEAELVAQPSVSRQIALLERELGTALFHRVGRRVVPTEAGIALAECAGRILDDIAATYEIIMQSFARAPPAVSSG